MFDRLYIENNVYIFCFFYCFVIVNWRDRLFRVVFRIIVKIFSFLGGEKEYKGFIIFVY